MVDQQKGEHIAKKQWREKEESSLSIDDDEYYNSKTFSNPDKKNGLNPLGDV